LTTGCHKNPENASDGKTKRKICNKIINAGNAKENVDERLRFIITLWDNINCYCEETKGFDSAKY
jgi:hypothetical protein